ncbi:MAG: Tyrosine recombinase XerC [Beijerinckiaceae bacterium]|nr:MAG: Tyrosine recombinase XerC [Beijerinckiaceae bacterium]
MTGARYGELIACSVRDFDPVAKTLKVDGKTGPRAIILQPEAVTFFNLISKDRAADEPLLRRSDGSRWSRSHQQRRMALALERAGLDKEGTFYALRHSYISRAIEGEVPLNIIGDNCGTSIRYQPNNTVKPVLQSKLHSPHINQGFLLHRNSSRNK